MANDGIFIDEGRGVVRLIPARVSLAHYPVRVGKSATTPLQLVLSIIRADGAGKPSARYICGRIEGEKFVLFGANGDSVYRLYNFDFGARCDEVNRHNGKQFVLNEADIAQEVAIRKDAEKIVAACNKKIKASQIVTGQIPAEDSRLRQQASNLVPNWSGLKAEERLAPIVDALRRLQSVDAPTVAKAATPVPPKPATPTKEPAPMPKPTKPTPAPESKPTPAPTGPELSPHARALIDALAKIGTPAVKKTMLATAGIPASAWSDALSEAYRARKITRDRSRTDNVYHVLTK
jgi:hypothetical protein